MSSPRTEVRSRTREVRFDIIRFMDHYLSAEASPHFRVFRNAKHFPRVTLDDVVISRERWILVREDFGMLLGETGTLTAKFFDVHAWGTSLGLPRHVFAVVPNEAKPFYVDFASPVCILFTRLGEPASEITARAPHAEDGDASRTCSGPTATTSDAALQAVDVVVVVNFGDGDVTATYGDVEVDATVADAGSTARIVKGGVHVAVAVKVHDADDDDNDGARSAINARPEGPPRT